MENYVPRRIVCEVLGIHYHTVYSLVKSGKLESIKLGKYNVYNLEKYMRENNIKSGEKKKICYCRVSSKKQKEDLKRQEDYMKYKYPYHVIISDIGSGLNFKRKGLEKIIKMGINNEIDELIITYKDRLARFGFELLEMILRDYSQCKIKIINAEEEKTPTEEMTDDIISIMNVYVAKVNGLRKYKPKVKKIMKKESIH
jgi:predicted site-specific integrase-resolvase